MKKAVIFDMDGLMIDSERLTYNVYKEEMERMGYPFTEEFYIRLLGIPKEKEELLYFEEYGDDFPMDDFWKDSHVILDERLLAHVPIKDGLVELLQYLKDKNYKTMVATSSQRSRVDKILERAQLMQYFDDVICGDEVSQGKPNPEIFLTACKKLHVATEEALVVEDSEAGIMAAHSGNIDVICIPDMKYPEPAYAKKTVHIGSSLHDVITFLKDIA